MHPTILLPSANSNSKGKLITNYNINEEDLKDFHLNEEEEKEDKKDLNK